MSPGATLAQALHGGEDYELIFTAPANARIPKSIAGVPITQIGRIVSPGQTAPVTLLTTHGRQPSNRRAGNISPEVAVAIAPGRGRISLQQPKFRKLPYVDLWVKRQ